MPFPILTIFLIFIIWFTIKHNQATKKNEQFTGKFWEREQAAGNTAKQDLSTLPYIQITLSDVPLGVSTNPLIVTHENEYRNLLDEKIVNFTGWTNTDLKLKYGPANLNALIIYDSNYTKLCRLLNSWAHDLHQLHYDEPCIQILEFGIQCGTDITAHYDLLAVLYHEHGQDYKIKALVSNAKELNSLSQKVIIRHLSQFVHI